ncbi:hypothetical protein Tco_1409174 [Tanacetum coccineum]
MFRWVDHRNKHPTVGGWWRWHDDDDGMVVVVLGGSGGDGDDNDGGGGLSWDSSRRERGRRLSGGRRRGGRRVTASGGGDQIDPAMRSNFRFRRKSPPEKFSGCGSVFKGLLPIPIGIKLYTGGFRSRISLQQQRNITSIYNIMVMGMKSMRIFRETIFQNNVYHWEELRGMRLCNRRGFMVLSR